MKKLIIASGLLIVSFAACKKDYDDVSKVVDVSYPTITLTGERFYSIPVGGSAPDVQATAYDSILKESYTPALDASVIDVQTPGLYIVPITATNRNGYIGQAVVYVAVTNIPEDYDLSGNYLREATGAEINIVEVANGLYSTDDVGGAPTLPITAYFAQISDSELSLPPQPTDAGTLSAINASVSVNADGDTLISWAVDNASFGTAQRTFIKVAP